MAKPVWGIELGTSSIKAVKMAATKDGLEIQAIDVVDLPEIDEELEQDYNDRLQSALVEFKNKNNVKGESCWISIPGHQTLNRLITLPFLDPKKFPETVGYEVQQQMPVSVSDIIWDYQMVDKAPKIGEDTEVALFAVRKEIINSYIEMMQAVGLTLSGIQVAPLAIYNFIKYDQKFAKSGIVVDIGADNTDLVIIDDQKLWIRPVPKGGSEITQELASKFKITKTEAEELKKKAAKSKQAQKIFGLMKPALRDLLSEIHRSMGFYKSQNPDVKLSTMMLMGGGSHLLGLKKFFEQQLQFRVEKLARLRKLQLARTANPEALQNNISSLAVSMGLAIQGLDEAQNNINLVPEEIKRAGQVKSRFARSVALAILMVAAALLPGLGVGNLATQGQAAQQAKKDAEAQIRDNQSQMERARDIQRPQNLLSQLYVGFRGLGLSVYGEEALIQLIEQGFRNSGPAAVAVRQQNAEAKPFAGDRQLRGDFEGEEGGTPPDGKLSYEEFRLYLGAAATTLGIEWDDYAATSDSPATPYDDRLFLSRRQAEGIQPSTPRWQPVFLSMGVVDDDLFTELALPSGGSGPGFYRIDDSEQAMHLPAPSGDMANVQTGAPRRQRWYRTRSWGGMIKFAVPVDDPNATDYANYKDGLRQILTEELERILNEEVLLTVPNVVFEVGVDPGLGAPQHLAAILGGGTGQRNPLNMYQVMAAAIRLDYYPPGVGWVEEIDINQQTLTVGFTPSVFPELVQMASQAEDYKEAFANIESEPFSLVVQEQNQVRPAGSLKLTAARNPRLEEWMQFPPTFQENRVVELVFEVWQPGDPAGAPPRGIVDLAQIRPESRLLVFPE